MTVAQDNRIAALTSLRFFAAACIVVGHGGSKAFFNYSVDIFDLRQAVSFFFVLSGFILSHAYQNLNYRTDLRAFMAARISRLWPAYVATALLAILAAAPSIQTVKGALIVATNLLMLQSWMPVSEWHYSVNSVSWSVSTEIFFYVVFPFALAAAARHVAWLLIGAIFSLGTMLFVATALNSSPVEGGTAVTAWGLLYIFPVARLAEFLAGMAAYRFAFVLHENSADWSAMKSGLVEFAAVLGTFGVVVLSSWLGKGALRDIAPQSSVWVQTVGGSVAFALLIAVLYRERGVISKILGFRALVYLGEISFSLYLLHQIVIRWMFSSHRAEAQADMALAYVLYWVISLAGAAAIFHFVEKPLRKPLRELLTGNGMWIRRV